MLSHLGGEIRTEKAAATADRLSVSSLLTTHWRWILTSLRGPHTTACEPLWTANALFLYDLQAKSGFYI